MIKSLVKRTVPAWLWTRLRLARIRNSIDRFTVRQVRHVYGSFPLEIYLADPLGAGWYDHDWPELPEIELLRRYRLGPGARVFDLGAHQCVVALMISRIVGPAGLVVAVEANAHNVAVGRKNRELNGAHQLQLVHAAVADCPGRLMFNCSLNGQVDDGSGQWGRVEVAAVTIDGLTHEYGIPDLLFVDVEGYEVKALQGAAETLRCRPDCFVEVHVGEGLEMLGGSVEAVLSFFPHKAYEIFVSTEAQPQPVPLVAGCDRTQERFFLMAVGRR
jgi:FkbM family methyltransferase